MNFSKDYIQKLKAKDQEAFQTLYLQTRQDLLSFIRYKVRGHQGLAEDILSEVYCKAIEYSHNLTLSHNVLAWLFRIAGTKIADHFRKHIRDQKLIFEQKGINQHKEILEGLINGPEAKILDKESLRIIQLAFHNLPKNIRELMHSKYIKDKKTKTIAEEVKKTPKAVESILYRGRKLLEKEIKKISNEKIYFFHRKEEDK